MNRKNIKIRLYDKTLKESLAIASYLSKYLDRKYYADIEINNRESFRGKVVKDYYLTICDKEDVLAAYLDIENVNSSNYIKYIVDLLVECEYLKEQFKHCTSLKEARAIIEDVLDIYDILAYLEDKYASKN